MVRQIMPFADEHLDDSARLLAARHRRDRQAMPALDPSFGDPDAVRRLLWVSLQTPGTRVAVMIEGGEMVGLLGGSPMLPAPTASWASFVRPRSVRIPYELCVATGSDRAEVTRELYAHLTPTWVRQGLLSHYVELPAHDSHMREAWTSLGFGQDLVLAVRDTRDLAAVPEAGPFELRQARREELAPVMRLVDALFRHHASPPMLFPYPPETRAELRADQGRLLSDPANAHWLATRDGEVVAMQSFHAQNFAEMARPPTATYLFQGVTLAASRSAGAGSALLRRSIAWARDTGYTACTLHVLTANLAGARFWTRHGFQPLTVRLMRQIDERILWAHGDHPPAML